MEVVLGLQPELPATLRAGLNVEHRSASAYAEDLLKYLKATHARVRQLATEMELEREGTDTGKPGARGLAKGDIVALKRPQNPKGVKRFSWTVDGSIYRIKAVLGENTYALEGLVDLQEPTVGNVANRFSADRLVKLDLPEWDAEFQKGGPRRLEIYDDELGTWQKARLEKMAVDGRTLVRFDATESEAIWMDLTRCRYRWIAEDADVAAPVADEMLAA